MRCRFARATLVATVLIVSGVLLPRSVAANPWDISLRGLGNPTVDANAQGRFRSLATEFGLAMSPRPLQPAETLGLSGFEFSLTNTVTDISKYSDYWQGQNGTPIFEAPLHDRPVPDMLWTPTLHIRKGLPLSTEVGVQATYLSFSELFMLGAEAKIALHEDFVHYLPAVALRASFARLFGSPELSLATGEADALLSYAFGVGGMMQVTPYAGYGMIGVYAQSSVLDATPYDVAGTDQFAGDGGSLYSFATVNWVNNLFPRYFGGVRLTLSMIEITYEFDLCYRGYARASVMSHSVKLGFDI